MSRSWTNRSWMTELDDRSWMTELDEPEPDTWELVPDAAVWPVIAAPASMERSPASFVP